MRANVAESAEPTEPAWGCGVQRAVRGLRSPSIPTPSIFAPLDPPDIGNSDGARNRWPSSRPPTA